ncbi:hypothetical protein DUI87_08595 [Hirundo rustica rustica]|uniref:Uncharacterized protein n=1 Tax=Hirundo rustica rustica TaxID=333673 RepID=A0A3M0KJU4_HIRRU|nr:hypothetical protein DUI87_08595 [Hirundo rustica rustica]
MATERIIEYYGPATWAQDGSWGYRTPVYLLNRLIRLQAVVEIVSNHTSDALELLAQQHSQMRAFAYQNRIALDYLLAEEGGVCGKFNESECCIEINDYGETIRGLAAEIKKVAHVPVQKMEFNPPGLLVGSIVWDRSLVEESGIFHFMFSGWVCLLTMLDTLSYVAHSHSSSRDANRIIAIGS